MKKNPYKIKTTTTTTTTRYNGRNNTQRAAKRNKAWKEM